MIETDNASQDEQFHWDAERIAAYYRRIHPCYRTAAEKLNFADIAGYHLRLSSSILTKETLLDELTPKSTPESIAISHSEITELMSLVNAGDSPSFSTLFDIRSILHTIELDGSTLYREEGKPLQDTIRAMRLMREYFAKRSAAAPTLWRSAVYLFDDKRTELLLDSVFDENGSIRDSASPALREIRRSIVITAGRIRSKMNDLVKRFSEDGLLQEEIITQRDGRYVVPVKVEHKRTVKGMIHSVSQTGQTVYIEPSEIIDLNNDLRSLEYEETREIDIILRSLADGLRSSVPAIRSSLGVASHLEAVYIKSRYAILMQCNTPFIDPNEKGQSLLRLLGARHPALIERLGFDKTVPFNLEMSQAHRTLVITGPNAGGKTVLLKTVGTIALMTLCGLPVPCSADSTLPLFSRISVDIGDAQSIADDLSTFSSHIVSLKNIVETADNNTLVLLDEIGSGTAPEEGGAFAESILEFLNRSHSMTIATTHYGRLAAFAETTDGALNGSMEFSSDDLRPTYIFRSGVPGSSHAFDIADRFEFPKHIIVRARELSGAKTTRLDDLIESLSKKEQEITSRKAEADKQLGKLRMEEIKLERERSELAMRSNEILQKASREANELLSEAVRALDMSKKMSSAVPSKERAETIADTKKTIRSLQEKASRHQAAATIENVSDLPIETGTTVVMRSNPSQTGEVLSIQDNDAEVLFGSMKIRVNVSQLVRTSSSKKTAPSPARSTFFSAPLEPRLDIRGLYGDEGVEKLEKYLSDAAAHNFDRVEIIHGMGTGALGKRIQKTLKDHPLVASFRYGEPNEGGAGVTIVELK
jgi:DNA mismatch repair protein MutS2